MKKTGREEGDTHRLVQILWNLCSFPRASLAFNDQDLVVMYCINKLVSEWVDWQTLATLKDRLFLLLNLAQLWVGLLLVMNHQLSSSSYTAHGYRCHTPYVRCDPDCTSRVNSNTCNTSMGGYLVLPTVVSHSLLQTISIEFILYLL